MWKSAAGAQVQIKDQNGDDDDWETDADYINDVSEQEQRWGSNTIEGSGRTAGAIDMQQLRKETEEADALKKKKLQLEGDDNASYGYGGKFGLQTDRMDKCAVGNDYIAKVEKHASQKDYSTGFGGKFGIQTDRVDQSAVNWDHKEKVEKHASQKDYNSGFGGKFGVQTDRQDKSAVGWDHIEKVEKHESQKDYSKGFGGKFGVQSDRVDKSAVGWDHHEAPQKHESQLDHKKGFGGKFGVQTDRVDKSAASYAEEPEKVGTNYTKVKPDIGGAKPSDLRAKFENLNKKTPSNGSSSNNTTPKKSVHAKAAMFSQQQKEENTAPVSSNVGQKKLDQSKTAFLNQNNTSERTENIENYVPKQLDHSKIAQFSNKVQESDVKDNSSQIREEIAQLRQQEVTDLDEEPEQIIPQKNEVPEEEIYQNLSPSKEIAVPEPEANIYSNLQEVASDFATSASKEPTSFTTEEIEDTGISAVALYDYQAAADDEISFDPDDEITHIEQIDEGWWRGLCKGKYGLFPANYVAVKE